MRIKSVRDPRTNALRSIRFKSRNPLVMIPFILLWLVLFLLPFIIGGFGIYVVYHFAHKLW